MPADALQPTPEEMEYVMGAWMTWAQKVGEGMLDFGTPPTSGTRVTPDGVSDSGSDIVGYTLIEAESLDAAISLAQEHPHLKMPGSCSIVAHEAQPVPGM